ncbi:hypothetical protein S40285_03678 [Stachybotrys chlorohalonatus IBT 40285]|uniref:molybdopterin adenylyltransferase n=1 Tax=Stachybotrys chlorohalonatus (strain IBT 40285) TaxID=1283841 RepID=A0A084QPZ6_STAC4|nr:hypothetical protein S40285_03678 [Stachybotrys chlorohalonata IBT 40285]
MPSVTISYASALAKLHAAAEKVKSSLQPADCEEHIPLDHVVGRVAARDYYSPIATPEHDTSAMDGYAVRSEATRCASPSSPAVFRVRGTIAAGDDPSVALAKLGTDDVEDMEPCVEIMTGGRFPVCGPGARLDACVRVEDTAVVRAGHGHPDIGEDFPGPGTYIAITKPIQAQSNRRFAGEDIQENSLVLRAGQLINSSHLLALASVGISSLSVYSKPRVKIWSTGAEVTSGPAKVRDVNGLYLTAAARELGAEAAFIGALKDDIDCIARTIQDTLAKDPADVLITSGGVSIGKFDYIRDAVEKIGATIIFHGLAIRPGHPVLFALLPSPRGKVAFFGLPGNPGAAAACFRFLVAPYLHNLLNQAVEEPVAAQLECAQDGMGESDHVKRTSCDRDIFRPGTESMTGIGAFIAIR